MLDVHAGHLLDQPAITRDRYVSNGPPATVPLIFSVTAPGAVATPPSTSTAAPAITEDILASQEPGLTTPQTQATVSGKTAPGATVDITVGQAGRNAASGGFPFRRALPYPPHRSMSIPNVAPFPTMES